MIVNGATKIGAESFGRALQHRSDEKSFNEHLTTRSFFCLILSEEYEDKKRRKPLLRQRPDERPH